MPAPTPWCDTDNTIGMIEMNRPAHKPPTYACVSETSTAYKERYIYLTGNALYITKDKELRMRTQHITLLPLPEKGTPLNVINVLSQSLRFCMRSSSSVVKRSLLHSS